MNPTLYCPRLISRLRAARHLGWPTLINATPIPAYIASRGYRYDGGGTEVQTPAEQETLKGIVDPNYWDEYRASFNVPRNTFQFSKQIPISQIGKEVTAVGFLGRRKDMGASMTFVWLSGGSGPERIQILARSEVNEDANRALRAIRPNSAVSVTGVLNWKYEAKNLKGLRSSNEDTAFINEVEIRLQCIQCLNAFPRDIQVNTENVYDPKDRHLQIRFDPDLRDRLKFRSEVATFARLELADFQEVETPVLFKSTPEGAREFIVPTRRKGFAYGLPQSPQQYKQILMASGINRYVQFAKCFRDEDHRADRQPEFTQIDLEMAWADGEHVMQRVEQFVKSLWKKFARKGTTIESALPNAPFIRMRYDEAMERHGSDKPDLRIRGAIHRIDHILPAALRGMLTSTQGPIVEAFKFKLNGDSKIVQNFVGEFMDSPEADQFVRNPDGAPGIFVFDSRRPLEGLQAFGFEGAENLKVLYAEVAKSKVSTDSEFNDGDLLFIQARENLANSGSSTMLGKLRLAIYKAALAQGLVESDRTHHFLWVTDFPMFTPDTASEPGQGGAAGFSATHHPFTAPKTAADLDMLLIDPLKAKADHYDLVLNGVELGGGSRRIHSSAMQKFIMRDILKMPENRMDDFSHLFEALRAGCPPHAGLAIGFDRLVAVMQGRNTVRDVIAFPKNSKGEDIMVGSPSRMTMSQLENYHIQVGSVGEKSWGRKNGLEKSLISRTRRSKH